MYDVSVPMSSVQTIFLVSYFVILCALCLAFAVGAWPTSGHLVERVSHVRLLWRRCAISREAHLALLTIVFGVLGATANYLWWFSHHAALGDLKSVQFIVYFVKPWIGGAVALIFYGLLRGGLVSGQGAAAELNSFGIMGIAGLVGLCANDVIAKLQSLFPG